MKTIKYIFLALVSLGFVFLTSCSSLQNMPYDDVYYSSQDNQAPQPVRQQITVVTPSANQNAQSDYQQGQVVQVDPNAPVTDTVYEEYSDQSAQRFYDNYAANNDCNCDDNSGFSLNLGFGNTYFGSSPWDWSFYGFNTFNPFWRTGFYTSFYSNPFYYDPYFYDPFYYSPYYGFSGYSPYYGANIWLNNPYYYNNYYFNYGNTEYGYNLGRRTYQVRHNRFGGSSLPRSVVSGSAYTAKQAKRAGRVVSGGTTTKRVPVNPNGRNGRSIKNAPQGRPAGSVRYQNDAARLKRAEIAKRAVSSQSKSRTNRYGSAYSRSSNNRTGVVRSPGSNLPSSSSYNQSQNRYQKPSGNNQVRKTQKSTYQTRKPRYQKPIQYQRIDSRRSSNPKVYYRTTRQPSSVRSSSSVKSSRTVSVKSRNVYRPTRTTTTRRSVYRPSSTQTPKVKAYSRPVRSRSTSSSYSAPTRTYRSTSTRSYSAPSRSSSSSSSSGSGSVSRTSRSGGGIRR
jgi:hypothetical protein